MDSRVAPGSLEVRPGRGARPVFLLVVAALAGAFVYLNRSEVSPALHGAVHARPLYIALAGLGSLAYLGAYSGLLQSSLAAVG